MKNKKIAIQALEAAPGLGTETVWSGPNYNEGKPNCAIGWLFMKVPPDLQEIGVYDSVQEFYGTRWSFFAEHNDKFEGSEKGRRDYMIELIKELSE